MRGTRGSTSSSGSAGFTEPFESGRDDDFELGLEREEAFESGLELGRDSEVGRDPLESGRVPSIDSGLESGRDSALEVGRDPSESGRVPAIESGLEFGRDSAVETGRDMPAIELGLEERDALRSACAR